MTYIPNIVSFTVAALLSVQVFCRYEAGAEVKGIIGRLLIGMPIVILSTVLYFCRVPALALTVPFLVLLFYRYFPNPWIWIFRMSRLAISTFFYWFSVTVLVAIFNAIGPWIHAVILLLPPFLYLLFGKPRRII